MGRKSTIGWVIGAFLLGYTVGHDPEPKSISKLPAPGISQLPKSDRVTSASKPIAKPVEPKVQLVQPVAKPPPNPTAQTQSFTPKTMYVDASRLNVRGGPGIENKQVWTLKQDEKVTVVGQSGEWLKLKGQRYEGWVFGTYLTPQPAPKQVTLTPAQLT